MKPDTRPNGQYGAISHTNTDMVQGTITEVWEGDQWYISHCLDFSIAGVHH